MTTTVKLRRILLLCLYFSPAGNLCMAQHNELDPKQWFARLSTHKNSGNKAAENLDSLLEHLDSSKVFQFLGQLEQKGQSGGEHFKARFNCIKARQVLSKHLSYASRNGNHSTNINVVKGPVANLFYSALDLAYKTEDDYLAAFISYSYAITIIRFGDIGVAIMYAKNSVELYEQLSYNIPPDPYQFLAETLFTVGEYNDCIIYGKKAIVAWQRSSQANKFGTITCMNTVGLGYHRQQQFDTALQFYSRALQLAEKEKIPVWVGIVSGNIAQIYYMRRLYNLAYSFFIRDYIASKDAGFYDNAANSLQWASRTSLAMGKKQRAVAELRESFELLRLLPDAKYLRSAYFTAMQVFNALSDYDSAFYYSNLYASLNDSLEQVKSMQRLDITRAKLSDMASQYTNQKLNSQKKNALVVKNIIITCVIVLSFIILLVINRTSTKAKLQKLKADEEKRYLEQEMASARNQLNLVTKNMFEKATLIEKLEEQLKGNKETAEYQAIISEITRLTLLTESNWTEFKSLFETIYPGFFIKLTNKFPDITSAEQRMAALTRLHLSSKQIASMLGISVDSVHKSRQRLRQRFRVGTEANLDEIVSAL